MNPSAYRKTIAAVVTGLIGWAAVVITSTPTAISASEWLMGGTALATALGVYATPNETQDGEAGQSYVGAVVAIVLLLIVLRVLKLI